MSLSRPEMNIYISSRLCDDDSMLVKKLTEKCRCLLVALTILVAALDSKIFQRFLSRDLLRKDPMPDEGRTTAVLWLA